MQKLEEINIVLYIILCVITLGLFYFVWQYKQMNQCNVLMEKNEHGLFKWLILSFITFGVYHFYHEYKMSQDIIDLQTKFEMEKVHGTEFPILCLIVSVFGLFLISDFIHQDELNKIIRKVNASADYQHLLR